MALSPEGTSSFCCYLATVPLRVCSFIFSIRYKCSGGGEGGGELPSPPSPPRSPRFATPPSPPPQLFARQQTLPEMTGNVCNAG